jgi:hypothetical protein
MNYFNKRSAQRNANYHPNANYQGNRQSMIRDSFEIQNL